MMICRHWLLKSKEPSIQDHWPSLAADDLEEPLMPSHLLTGHRVLGLPDSSIPEVAPDFMASTDRAHVTSWMNHLNLLLQHFWKRCSHEYLTELRDAHRYSASPRGSNKEITFGDIVLVHDEKHPRAFWKLGKVAAHQGTGWEGMSEAQSFEFTLTQDPGFWGNLLKCYTHLKLVVKTWLEEVGEWLYQRYRWQGSICGTTPTNCCSESQTSDAWVR